MRVLIFEICFFARGHRIPYAAVVAEAFADHDVIVALPAQLKDQSVLRDYFPSCVKFQFFKSEQKAKPLAGIRESWRCLTEQIKVCRPDMVAVPTADGMAFWGGIRNLIGLPATGGIPINISLMRGHFRSPSDSWVNRTISNFKWWVVTKGPWRKTLLIDPRSFHDLKNPAKCNVVLCPDPAPPQAFDSRLDCRKALAFPEKGRMIVSVGNQEFRKGTDLLLQAFERATLAPDDFLVLMGKFDSQTRHLAEQILQNGSKKDRLIVRNSFVSDDELQQAVVASNLVAVPYRDVERPSGIVSRSVAWNRPVIGTDRGWIKWFIDQYEAGYTTDPDEIPKFSQDLRLALTESEHFRPSSLAEKFQAFNSEQSYRSVWRALTKTEDRKTWLQ